MKGLIPVLFCLLYLFQPCVAQVDSAVYYMNRDPKKALAFGEASLEKAEQQRNEQDAFEAHKILGVIMVQSGESEKALYHLNACREIADKLQVPKAQGAAHNNLGNYYNFLGQAETALSHYIKALEYRQQVKDSLGISRVLINIGILQDELGRWDDAMESYAQAMPLKKALGDSIGQGLILQNMAIVLDEKGESEEALRKLEAAREIFESKNDQRFLASVFVNLGNISNSLGRTQDALDYLNEGIRLAEEINDLTTASEGLVNAAKLHQGRENFDLAEQNYRKSLAHAEASGSPELQALVHLGFSGFFESILETDSALRHLQIYMSIQGELLDEESMRHLEELEARYKTSLKEHIINTQNVEIQLLEQGKQIRLLIIGGLAILLLSLVGLGWLWRRRKNAELQLKQAEKEKLATEVELKARDLELKNKELVSFTLQMAQKNTLIEKLKADLQEAAKQSQGDSFVELKALERQLEKIGNVEDDWQDFRRRYEQVEGKFFETLGDRFPQLTSSDHRICALIRLQLNTKEIASTLNISPDSVNKSRYRIKKKMNLEKDENLTDFIQRL